jgi:hypothetical protein
MYIYKITIDICGVELYYIGKCETGNPNYVGSGLVLKRYYKKYGMGIIKSKDILYETTDSKALGEAEKRFILENDAVNDKRFLNLTSGGDGGNTFAGKTKEEVKHIMLKRKLTLDADPSIMERRVNKWKVTISDPLIKEKMLENIRTAIPRRINSYKRTRSRFSTTKKAEISRNISIAVRKARSKETKLQRTMRKEKELLTKSNRTKEQREHESRLKSQSSRLAAANRTVDEWVEYGKKVSEGVKRYRASQTVEDKEKITMMYRETMYKKNGMYDYINTIRDMISCKSSLEIFHFLKARGIKTHHICVKGFIDFIEKYTKLII